MRPVENKYKMHFGFGELYPKEYWGLTSDNKHKGMDFLCPKGTPVYAGVNGIIVYFGTQKDFGLNVKIEFKLYENTFRLILAHLSKINSLIMGQKIHKLDIIGWSGDSGSAKNHPHLHCQVNKLEDGKWNPINPEFAIGNKFGSV